MSQDIRVDGVDRWVPLEPVPGAAPGSGGAARTAAEYADLLVRRFPSTPRVELVADSLAGLLQQMLVEQADDPTSRLLAAWVLTEESDVLAPLAVAALRAVLVHRTDQAVDVAALVLADTEIVDGPHLETLDTASGPAQAVVARTAQGVDGETVVREGTTVVWPRAEHGYVVVLSTQVLDLVAGRDVPDLLLQLAAGVHGL